MRPVSLLSALAVGIAGACAAEPVRDVTYFLKRLRTVDHLPELEDSHTAMSSTWNRTGSNHDGFDYKRIEPDGRNILLDVAGPGCLHRIMAACPGHADRKGFTRDQQGTRIQIFLDHTEQPLIDLPLNDFFVLRDKTPFPYPLAFEKTYPGCLHPIPFREHCRVQLVNPRYGTPRWKKGVSWGGWWQVTYTIYPKGANVRTLALPLDETAKREQAAVVSTWLKAEASPPDVPETWSVNQNLAVPAGEYRDIRLNGSGVIRQLRVATDDNRPESLKSLRLQLFWDGSESASVDVPVGYFFGHANTGHDARHKSGAVMPAGTEHRARGKAFDYSCNFNSLLIGVLPEEAYACFPMPFADGAVVRLRNTHTNRVVAVRCKLDVQNRETLPGNWGRFHATFSEEYAHGEQSLKLGPANVPSKAVLRRRARGKYIGVLLHVDWPQKGWWGEGDWMIWSDEDESRWPPSYHGTGSEEYFQGGCAQFDRKAISGFVSGRPGHPTVYSFHLNDAFQFRENILVAEEQMGLGKSDAVIREGKTIWSSTAYWYADRPLPAQSGKVLGRSSGERE